MACVADDSSSSSDAAASAAVTAAAVPVMTHMILWMFSVGPLISSARNQNKDAAQTRTAVEDTRGQRTRTPLPLPAMRDL